MRIVVDSEGIFQKEGIDPANVTQVADEAEMIVAGLKGGIVGGGTSVTILMPTGDGNWVMGQTSLKLLILAAEAFVQQYGYPDMSEYGIGVAPGQMREKVKANLATLGQPERRVMELRFGLDREDGTPRSIDQVAAEMNTSANNIRVIENRALVKLRRV
jgi:hypothetical protein